MASALIRSVRPSPERTVTTCGCRWHSGSCGTGARRAGAFAGEDLPTGASTGWTERHFSSRAGHAKRHGVAQWSSCGSVFIGVAEIARHSGPDCSSGAVAAVLGRALVDGEPTLSSALATGLREPFLIVTPGYLRQTVGSATRSAAMVMVNVFDWWDLPIDQARLWSFAAAVIAGIGRSGRVVELRLEVRQRPSTSLATGGLAMSCIGRWLTVCDCRA